MYLWHIFLVKPLSALSILLCLFTIFSCVMLERKRPHNGADRFLIAFLGLLSVYQGMRILQDAGIVALGSHAKVDDVIEVALTAFYLLATLMLRMSAMDRLQAESAMRLVRAAPPRAPFHNPEAERDLARLNWALPRLSDSAFRLYAYLCLRHDPAGNRGAILPSDVRIQLAKSKDEVDRDMAELESAGAILISRSGPKVGITIVAQPAGPGVQLTGASVPGGVAAIPEGVLEARP